ncbi:hypothetical protein ACFOYU_19975 [Microvirga sp. GCM10011540]|uniref:hypothetical protein n=1 Tax=Microvirga sp. GCM10011540 TaxID=3317338 RepID=UPI0036192F35
MWWRRRLSDDRGRSGARVIETSAEARQGPKGRPVLMVLGGSFALLGLYLVGMMVWAVVSAPSSPREEAALSRPAVVDDLRPRTEPDQSEIPPANPAYPVPVED